MVLFGFLCKLLGRIFSGLFHSFVEYFHGSKLAMINPSFEQMVSLLKADF
jgi:hypothetical protein